MAGLTQATEIERSAADVFAYLDELDRHGEWQEQIVSTKVETEGPPRVGTRVTEVRKVPGGKQAYTYEITAYDPPRRTSFRVLDGPIRPVGTVTVEPLGETRSRVTIEIDFEGHGFGKLLVPLARRDARKRLPVMHERLKERLESGAA